MGLDMYLEKAHMSTAPFINQDLDEIKKNVKLYEFLKPYLIKKGNDKFQWETFTEEVGYWRKANQIHNWFVNNVQNGIDNCGYYHVNAEQLKELRNICIQVIEKSILRESIIIIGHTHKNGEVIPITEHGKVIINKEEIAELLPTRSGFFFGNINYDEYYLKNVKETINIINKVMKETNFDMHTLFYSSSW